VIVQRINLGLFAMFGDMRATADWRGISEEIWPFTQAPPSTPLGEAEQPWLESRRQPEAGLCYRRVRRICYMHIFWENVRINSGPDNAS
jgi:hypothetical protein